jgi:hypothetical protein
MTPCRIDDHGEEWAVVELRLIGPPEEVAALVETMQSALRVQVNGKRKSRDNPEHVLWYAAAEQLLLAERPRRVPVRGPKP